MALTLRLFALSGKFTVVRTIPDVANVTAARCFVEQHIEGTGYTMIQQVEDEDGWSVRFTARTPGGRSGRNVAAADHDGSDL